MDYPRDLGQVELWQESLERSLARRGRSKRSSVELLRLRGERDLRLEEVVLESAQYSRLRRRAAERPLVPRPAAAVRGVSALTVLAVTTLPGLLGGRNDTNQRITYAAKVRARGRVAKGSAIASLQPRSVSDRALAGDSTPVVFRRRAAPNVLPVSESVRRLQRRLGVVADGDFGPITLRAVEGFQASRGLVVDGIVGPATRAALGLPPGPILRANPIYFPKRYVTYTVRAVTAYGIDFSWGTVSARSAWNMGARLAASYLSGDPSKNWTRTMIRNYHAAGLGTVCVWETTATRALAGYAAGQTDALAAQTQEVAVGVPASKPIYFAVDFDETPGQAPAVAAYFRGIDSVLGVNRTGGYGGYWTISRLFNSQLIRFGWQTSAWSGGQWDSRAQLQQYAYYNAYDWDRAVASAYGATL